MEGRIGLTLEDVAGRAGVDVDYIRRLIDLGVVGPGKDGYRERDVHVTALLRMWEEADLTAESSPTAAESGSCRWTSSNRRGGSSPPRLDRTYRQLEEERSLRWIFLQTIQQAIGFVPPDPDELAKPDDAVIADLAGFSSSTSAVHRMRSGDSSASTRTTFAGWRSRRPTFTWSRSSFRAGARERASRS